MPNSTSPLPARSINPRQELFAHHVAHGASLAQAARLAGYSAQGARQRGSVLMTNSDIRVRVEEIRRGWMADRQKYIAEAIEEMGQVVETALRLDRPTAAMKACEFKLKLRGVIHDRRLSLYTESPDDDLSMALFDPQEDEDPPLEELASPSPPVTAPPAADPPAPEPPPKPAPSAKPHAASASAPVLRMPPPPPGLMEALETYKKALAAPRSAPPTPLK